MGILRSDVVSHSQLEPTGSVLFDGTGDYLTIPSHSSFAFGTGDFSVECWAYFTSLTGQHTLVGDTYGETAGWYWYKRTDHKLGFYYTNSNYWAGETALEADTWYHLAAVRNNGVTSMYINGVHDKSATDTTDCTVTQYYIGDTAGTSSGEIFGYISNVRITRTAVYKQNFTVPKFILDNHPGTVLLCCQSSSSATTAAVSPGTITASGNAAASAFAPDLKEDITDTGVVFEDNTRFDTLSYMVPPAGNSRERNRGRGLIAGGCTPLIAEIEYIQIQSQGNSTTFGNLSATRFGLAGCASATRGLFGGGAEPSIRNYIEFVTIASTGENITDFGDLTAARRDIGALSNQTRGMWTGGNPGSSPNATDTIDFVTIATAGNASDFGNLTASMKEVQSSSSPTRGIMGGGNTVPATVNTIQFITIASTGNASDFGDLTRTAGSLSTAASATRAVFANGGTNTIDYITIASTGNATDFGDTTAVRGQSGGVSNSIRGVFTGGYQPSPTSSDANVIDFIEFATTGNAKDFGDIDRAANDSNREHGTCSDSHGGIS